MSAKEKSRTYNSVVNSIIGILAAVINIIVNFAVRFVIVRVLGDEINGIHSLFQNVITVLTLMETTISTAMIIHLYKPVKDDDKAQIKELMGFYRKLYSIFAVMFFAAGMVINLLIPFFITTTVDLGLVHFYFILFSLSFALYYFTFANRCLLYAEQNNRVSTFATMLGELIFRGTGMIFVLLYKEYWLFLVFLILEKLFSNAVCNAYIKRRHPYLGLMPERKTNTGIRKKIFATVRPLFVNQIALTIQNSSTSVIISMLLGNVSSVGFYGNYQLIINAVNTLFSQIGASFTSGFGNLASSDDKEKMKMVYSRVLFIISTLGIVCCCGFLTCVQDFIVIAFGENSVLGMFTTILLTLNMFITLTNIPIISIQNATGTHRVDAVNMIIQAVAVIVLSYIGGMFWGLEGIILGLLLPTFVFTSVIKGILISRKCMKLNTGKYVKDLIIIFLKCAVSCAVTIGVGSLITFESHLLNIVIKGAAALVVSFVMIFITSFKNENFHYMLSFLHLAKKGK